jgi:hypothetical protein
MDVSAIASAATAMSQQKVGDAAGTLVLRKALDIQASNAAQLLQALPPPQPAPASKNIIDTYA